MSDQSFYLQLLELLPHKIDTQVSTGLPVTLSLLESLAIQNTGKTLSAPVLVLLPRFYDELF